MASIQRRSGQRGTKYRVMWRLQSGEQRSRTFGSYDEARAFKSEQESLERRGVGVDPQKGRTTLTAWSEAFLATLHVKPKSLEAYKSLLRSRILPVLGAKQLAEISRLDVQQWVAAMSQEVSARRCGAAYALLNQMLAEAVRHELILRNPADGVRTPKAQQRDLVPLTLDELRAVASHCGRYEPLVLWLGVMGTRWAEAVGMTWEQFVNGHVVVDRSLSEVNGRFHDVAPKTYAIRRLPVPDAIAGMLPVRSNGLVFTTTYGNPIRSARFRADVFLPALEAAGLESIRIHDLRHIVASNLIEQGANVKMVQSQRNP